MATADELWAIWQRKNPGQNVAEARAAVLHHLELLEARRPLDKIEGLTARDRAEKVRHWVRHVFCEVEPA